MCPSSEPAAPGPADALTPPAVTSARFGARSPWTPAGAMVFALATVALASAAAVLTGAAYFQSIVLFGRQPEGALPTYDPMLSTMVTMAVMQLVVILLVWWAAGRYGADRAQVLSLDRAVQRRQVATALAGMALILAPYNAAIYLMWPDQFATDLRMFSELARSQAAWIAVVVVTIGAPLSEELLFRGFLLPAVANSRAGFIGSALLTTFAWTIMHFGYSLIGLMEVFVIGLYFSWLMWKFQCLRLTILLHAVYNGMQMAILMLIPLMPRF